MYSLLIPFSNNFSYNLTVQSRKYIRLTGSLNCVAFITWFFKYLSTPVSQYFIANWLHWKCFWPDWLLRCCFWFDHFRMQIFRFLIWLHYISTQPLKHITMHLELAKMQCKDAQLLIHLWKSKYNIIQNILSILLLKNNLN